MATLKIGYYRLQLMPKGRAEGIDIHTEITGLLSYIMSKSLRDRIKDIPKINLFYFLENSSNGMLVFEHNRYNYRPKLRKKTTLAERDSPKDADEGDEVKVHIAIKRGEDNEELVFIEEKRGGMWISNFVQYLNHFMEEWIEETGHLKLHFRYTIVLEPEFEEKLRDSLVKSFELDALQLNVKQKIVNASGYLRFSERDSQSSKVKIRVVAEKKQSIREGLKSLLARRGNEKVAVTSITILDRQGNRRKLNIARIKRVKRIKNCTTDESTGEVRASVAEAHIRTARDEFDD